MWSKIIFLLGVVYACLMYDATADFLGRRFTKFGYPPGRGWVPNVGFLKLAGANQRLVGRPGEDRDTKDKFNEFRFSRGTNSFGSPPLLRRESTDEGLKQGAQLGDTEQQPLARFRRDSPYGFGGFGGFGGYGGSFYPGADFGYDSPYGYRRE